MTSTSMFTSMLKKNGRHQSDAALAEIWVLGKWGKRQALGDYDHLSYKSGKEFTFQIKIDLKFQMLHWCIPWPFSYSRKAGFGSLSQSKVFNETWLRKKTQGERFSRAGRKHRDTPRHSPFTSRRRNLSLATKWELEDSRRGAVALCVN